ncbi:hypothetical protein V5N11_012416 [Cardamine amara subsp. amara]|uniref:PRA1 family protein n=1 Tax=Cardamine amara subsp. amara TaxID=228776 RepID=A0ABD0ZCW5_CARAN
METVSADNQTLSIPGDEMEMFNAYSAAVHKVVTMVNAGIIGLLQLMNQQYFSVFETQKPTLICFCLLVFFYVVLRVREAIDLRRGYGFVARLVGHTSHLFGGLAALVLISVVCMDFAYVLLLLWFVWLSTVVYNTFNDIKIIYSEANRTSADSPHSSRA